MANVYFKLDLDGLCCLENFEPVTLENKTGETIHMVTLCANGVEVIRLPVDAVSPGESITITGFHLSAI